MFGVSDYVAAPVIVVGALLVLLAVGLGAVVGRRYLLGRQVVSFDCALRKPSAKGRGGWMLGVARYTSDQLEWFRVFTLTFRPRRLFERGLLEVTDRRAPDDTELDSVLPGSLVVRCRYRNEIVELAMSEQAYSGFATWLESAPPGIAPLAR